MSFPANKRGCFKCGNRQYPPSLAEPSHAKYNTLVGHIAENCTSDERLCYNCRQPGHESSACPSPRTVSAKQCYSCGGVGHLQSDCPTLRLQNASVGQKCFVCSRVLSLWSLLTFIRLELRSPWPHCAYLSFRRDRRCRCRRICITRAPSRTGAEHVHIASSHVLSLRRTKPHGQVSSRYEYLNHALLIFIA